MKISVIIPVYNQKPEYFKEAIESVINQTVKPDEIIVVDDGSDIPVNVVLPDAKGIEIKLIINEENMGVGYSRQRGADEVSKETDYISFLASDDVWDERFLEVMIKTAEQQPDKILYSNYYFIDKDSNAIGGTGGIPYFDYEDFCIAAWVAAENNTMFTNISSFFIPKEVFKKVQFDKKLRFAEDLDFLLKSMKHFEYYFVKDYILKYRTTGMTHLIKDKISEQNIKIRENCMRYWKK